MKQLLLLATGILFFFSNANAQLVADAGGPILYTCLGGPTTITVGGSPTAFGGVPPYSYLWIDTTGFQLSDTSANPVFQGPIPEMVLCLTVTDSTGAQAFDTVSLVHYPWMVVSVTVADTQICRITDALFSSVITGGIPPYSYVWNFGDGDQSTQPNPQHTYFLTGNILPWLIATDSAGCSEMGVGSLTVLPSPIVDAGPGATICAGDSVILGGSPTASGGNPPYTYSWAPSFNLNFPTSANPVAYPGFNSTYSVTVVDANGCSDGNIVTITVQPCGSGFSISTQNATCFSSCDGSATVTPPAGNYNYQWNNTATTATISGLCAGTYTVTVMDSVLNPLDTLSVTINQPNPLIVQPGFINDVLCNGGSNGSAQVVVTGGTPPYNFMWSNGSVTLMQNNLSAGTYIVTVIDVSTCTALTVVNVSQPPPMTFSTITTAESVTGACDGSIDITASGGTLPYNFFWSNNATTEDLTGLCAGTYTATITDSNGCTVSATDVVAAACPNNTIVLSISSTGDIDCTRMADTLTANATGGTPGYTFIWSTGATTQSIIVNQAGVYTTWVTDAVGCVRTASDTVLNLGVFVSLQSAIPLACNGVSNGKIKVSVSGGTQPYTYLWSNGAAADSIVGIPSGSYQLTVTDAALCTATFSYFLNQGSTNWSYYVYVSSTHANCTTNGSATANVVGGTGPYTYLWNTTPPQTSQTATGLTAGQYTVTVTGSDGCTRTGQAYISTSCFNIVQGYIYITTTMETV